MAARYKIKITTYANGRKEYRAYVKGFFGWTGLWLDGSTGHAYSSETRGRVLEAIDKHHDGNARVNSIVFEYIIKP